MVDRTSEREPRRDPGDTLPRQAPGAERVPRGEDDPAVPSVEVGGGRIAGASEDFTPQRTTDIAQHAPGPHGQGDEPTSAVAGEHDYDDSPAPQVRDAPPADRPEAR